MTDAAAPRQARGWPLFAISLLILLLAGFLVLRLMKRDNGPLLVKESPPKLQPATGARGPEPAADPEWTQKLSELRGAIQSKRWDEAAAAFEAARKLRPDAPELTGTEEAIAEGRKREEAARVEAARNSEQRRKMERAWALLKEQVEKYRTQNLWDAAIAALKGIARDYPDILHDTDYERQLRQVGGYQEESDHYFRRDLAECQKLLTAESYGPALLMAESALKYYPERKDEVRKLEARIRDLQIQKTMVRIPSTPCWIGSDSWPEEKPLRRVKLPDFLIDRYLVTNEDFAAFVAATDRPAPLHWPGGKPQKGRERHPVVFVTWDDAAAYAQWAGKRLPTAEEWEVAARGPDKREFPWGTSVGEKEEAYPCNCLEYWQVHKSLSPGTTPVDAKEFDRGESAFGVFGMGGNVWEWTSSAAPAKGSKPPPEFRILKGGSFMTPQKAARCAKVYAEDPRLPHPDVGFRCARDVN